MLGEEWIHCVEKPSVALRLRVYCRLDYQRLFADKAPIWTLVDERRRRFAGIRILVDGFDE